jgi:hypothetical protein
MSVMVREFEPGDGPGLAELDRQAAEGVLPAEWERWADEPHRTIVAFRGTQMVGAAHVAIVGRGEGWIEGVRVVPPGEAEAEDRLVQHALSLARGYGALVVRASAPVGSPPRWLNRHGFEAATAFDVLVADAPPGTMPPNVDVVQRKNAGPVVTWLREEVTSRARGLVPLGWRFRQFAEEIVTGAVREGRLLAQRDPPGAAVLLRRGEDRVVNVLFCADPARLLGAVYADLSTGGPVAAFVLAGSEEGRRLRDQGLLPHPWCADGIVVLGRTVVA